MKCYQQYKLMKIYFDLNKSQFLQLYKLVLFYASEKHVRGGFCKVFDIKNEWIQIKKISRQIEFKISG